jgi:hypothetical protein
MKSQLKFLAAALAAGFALLISAATAQELPVAVQSVWLASTKLSYDPLLVAASILAMTMAVGRSVDVVRARNKR